MVGLQIREDFSVMKYIISVPGIPNAICVDCKGSLTLTTDYTVFIKLCIADRVVAIKDKSSEIPKEYKYFLLFWWVSYFPCANRMKIFNITKRKLSQVVDHLDQLSPRVGMDCHRSSPHAAHLAPFSNLSWAFKFGESCELKDSSGYFWLISDDLVLRGWNLVVDACAMMFPPMGFLGSAYRYV